MNGNGRATSAAAPNGDWRRRLNGMKLTEMGVSMGEDDDFCSFNGNDVAEIKREVEHRYGSENGRLLLAEAQGSLWHRCVRSLALVSRKAARVGD